MIRLLGRLRPRRAADHRTLLWALGLFPGAVILACAVPELRYWLIPLGLYLGFCAGMLSHNHNHCPTFHSRRANAAFAAWLSFFYGYPLFAWAPTHNANHHKLVNRPGDNTITWRITRRHTAWAAWTYAFVSLNAQAEPVQAFVRKARRDNPALWRQIVVQYVVVLGGHLAILAIAMLLHGPGLGASVYACACLLPAVFAMWSTQFLGYLQHVDCDPWSPYNHSRNFVSKVSNWLTFNNGLHTAHHETPGAHWSTLPARHQQLAGHVDPALQQGGILSFVVRSYLLAPFSPRHRTRQIGRAAYDPPEHHAAP